MKDLAVLQTLTSKSKTQQQQYISLLLDEHDGNINTLLGDLVYISKNAVKSTPDGSEIDDHRTRLQAIKLLLELRGDYTPSKANMQVNVGFNSLIYGNKDADTGGDSIIQGG